MYAVERVCDDQIALKRLWISEEVMLWLQDPNNRKYRSVMQALDSDLINNPLMWKRLRVVVDVLTPVRVALRGTDTDTANLHLVAELFHNGAMI